MDRSGPAQAAAKPRKELNWWHSFNSWWRDEYDKLGRRPRMQEVDEWYHENAGRIWGAEKPSLEATRDHAKCLRSKKELREYFQRYNAKKFGRPFTDLRQMRGNKQRSGSQHVSQSPGSASDPGIGGVSGGGMSVGVSGGGGGSVGGAAGAQQTTSTPPSARTQSARDRDSSLGGGFSEGALALALTGSDGEAIGALRSQGAPSGGRGHHPHRVSTDTLSNAENTTTAVGGSGATGSQQQQQPGAAAAFTASCSMPGVGIRGGHQRASSSLRPPSSYMPSSRTQSMSQSQSHSHLQHNSLSGLTAMAPSGGGGDAGGDGGGGIPDEEEAAGGHASLSHTDPYLGNKARVTRYLAGLASTALGHRSSLGSGGVLGIGQGGSGAGSGNGGGGGGGPFEAPAGSADVGGVETGGPHGGGSQLAGDSATVSPAAVVRTPQQHVVPVKGEDSGMRDQEVVAASVVSGRRGAAAGGRHRMEAEDGEGEGDGADADAAEEGGGEEGRDSDAVGYYEDDGEVDVVLTEAQHQHPRMGTEAGSPGSEGPGRPGSSGGRGGGGGASRSLEDAPSRHISTPPNVTSMAFAREPSLTSLQLPLLAEAAAGIDATLSRRSSGALAAGEQAHSPSASGGGKMTTTLPGAATSVGAKRPAPSIGLLPTPSLRHLNSDGELPGTPSIGRAPKLLRLDQVLAAGRFGLAQRRLDSPGASAPAGEGQGGAGCGAGGGAAAQGAGSGPNSSGQALGPPPDPFRTPMLSRKRSLGSQGNGSLQAGGGLGCTAPPPPLLAPTLTARESVSTRGMPPPYLSREFPPDPRAPPPLPGRESVGTAPMLTGRDSLEARLMPPPPLPERSSFIRSTPSVATQHQQQHQQQPQPAVFPSGLDVIAAAAELVAADGDEQQHQQHPADDGEVGASADAAPEDGGGGRVTSADTAAGARPGLAAGAKSGTAAGAGSDLDAGGGSGSAGGAGSGSAGAAGGTAADGSGRLVDSPCPPNTLPAAGSAVSAGGADCDATLPLDQLPIIVHPPDVGLGLVSRRRSLDGRMVEVQVQIITLHLTLPAAAVEALRAAAAP